MARLQQREPLAGSVLGALAGFLARDLDVLTLVSYWGDRLVLVAAGAILGALLGAAGARRLVAGGTLLLAGLWLAVAVTPLAAGLAAGLRREDAPARADAVYVLASSVQADGDFTDAALARLVRALELIASGYTQRLIVSELPPPRHAYAAPARALAAHLGLSPELLAVGPVTTTREEAVAVGALCRERGFRRLLVVTSPLHTRRASGALEREGIEVISIAAPETRYDIETLPHPTDRFFTFAAALHERFGLWLYARRGWLATSR